ncbi:RNA polymerase ECF family sigma subunit [Stackebrandtia endophytica]|uniref:RNA polymerase ECF family sigma subunit n=1 Tax=Stackebrandtia endophytica TaxID=1496996 RepID=A0A543AUL5_9ACTN|nr:DUF6596 domain-containing protein [Stackebrandtia endophytica]TQL76276.1 RNA polymerase ECF family sigma subunit [Stackebrandtia endophytica]
MNNEFEDVWRRATPHVLGALARRHDNFADCEDAVQLALVAAAEQWPREGLPDNPTGWLIRVAGRRLIDLVRTDVSRRSREERTTRLTDAVATAASESTVADDTLLLLILCAHPALTPSSQAALMLRAVAGLTTREIAMGFFVPEATMAQRISRAKASLRDAGGRFQSPPRSELPARLHAVRHAVALLYTQAHSLGEPSRSPGRTPDSLLPGIALRLSRELHRLAPTDPENAGLLALLLLTQARAPARLDPAGELVPLEDQDRRLWNREYISEGIALIEKALPTGYVGSFQLQAAIAAVHAEGASTASTDWEQILVLYEMLEQVDPTPAATLGRAVATAEAIGPAAGLAILAELPESSHRRHAAAGHMLSRLGRRDEARSEFLRAAELTRSIPEQRYLNRLGTQAI